jgi:hypothetical protein
MAIHSGNQPLTPFSIELFPKSGKKAHPPTQLKALIASASFHSLWT